MIRKLRTIIAAFVLFFSLTGSYAFYMAEIGNFHEIRPGEAYRSAQLDNEHLEHYTKKYGIRSILNLRGENSQMQWYRDEIKISKSYRLEHYDVTLSYRASRLKKKPGRS